MAIRETLNLLSHDNGKPNYYLLEIYIDKIKLIPEPKQINEEDEFLEVEERNKIEAEEERISKIIRKLLIKVNFLDFPTIRIDQDEYKEPDTSKKKKVFTEWARNEDEDDDEDRNWLNELKEKFKEIEKEEEAKGKEDNQEKIIEEQEKAKAKEKMENDQFIGISLFFAMEPQAFIERIKNEQMNITVFEYGVPADKTETRYIGKNSFSLPNTLGFAIGHACSPNSKIPTTSCVHKDIELNSENENNRVTAVVSIFVRITCMGYTPYPEDKFLPVVDNKEPTEIELMQDNLKSMSRTELLRICPLDKKYRTPECLPIRKPH